MFEYEINNSEVTITGYKDKIARSIMIPKFIEGYLVTKIGNRAFDFCYYLTDIIIPNSVTNIAKYVLYYCDFMVNINNIKVNRGVNIINNRFIYYNQRIYKINYQIGNDYCGNNIILINGEILN